MFFLQQVKWGDRVEKSVALWCGVLVAVFEHGLVCGL